MTNSILPYLLGFLAITRILVVSIACFWFKGKCLEEKSKSIDEILSSGFGWFCNLIMLVISITMIAIILACLEAVDFVTGLVIGLIAVIEIGVFPFLLEACVMSEIYNKCRRDDKGGD